MVAAKLRVLRPPEYHDSAGSQEVVGCEEEGQEKEGWQEGWQEDVRTRLKASLAVLHEAVEEHKPSHVFALFSGGHDSLCSTAVTVASDLLTSVVHINTGVGIPETRDYVRGVCGAFGWPLEEMHPDAKTYRDLVAEKGMPGGPAAHNSMYYWLKQRQIRRLVREHKQGRHGRVMLITGIRKAESERRMGAGISVPVRRQGAQVWVNPILDWTKADCHDFMEWYYLPRNPVVDKLHRSGECLCGALAHHSEIREIEFWYPDTAAELHGYEQLARSRGHLEDVWAGRLGAVSRLQQRFDLELCQSCIDLSDRSDAA